MDSNDEAVVDEAALAEPLTNDHDDSMQGDSESHKKSPGDDASSSNNEDSEDDDDRKMSGDRDEQPMIVDEDGRPLSEYERQRLERIERNKAYLQQLGLHEIEPAPKRRAKKKEPSEAAPPVKSRFSSRATKQTVVSYTEPSLSVAALVRQEKAKKEPKEKKPPKEPKPPRERKETQSRMERSIYDEFQRISKHKKLVLKHVERDVKAAEKEIKFWSKRVDRLDRREQRKSEASSREHQVEQERQVLGGVSKRELLQQVDNRTEDIITLIDKYDEEFEADELARERQIQRKEIETRNKTLDALDRFPKALHDSHALLNTILLQRLPKDPPPPRRSRRSSGPEPEANIESSGSPNKKKRARPSQGESTVLDPSPQRDWRDAQSFQDTSLADMEQQPDEDDERESAPQATARIRTRSIRNVGGWISPNMAKLVDRSWLERDTPVESGKGLNISSYAPQVGEAILYYPLGHKEWLTAHPDVLGKKLRSAQRVPLWERPLQVDDGHGKGEGPEWCTQEWLQAMNEGTANYPILCRVEKSYAEFPPDPFTKVIKKNGSSDDAQVVWKPPKDPALLKQATGAPLRLALILRPLTPLVPPDADQASVSFALPPTFSVVTFPATQKPFIIPFSYAYTLWHSMKIHQKVSHDRAKAQINQFAVASDSNTCRLDDELSEVTAVVKHAEQAVSLTSFLEDAFSGGAKGLPIRDCGAVVKTMQSFVNSQEAGTPTDEADSETTPPDMMNLIARTLPLWNGVGSIRNVHDRRKKWMSPWEIGVAGSDDWLRVCTPDGLATSGFDEALRRKLETVIEDFAWDDPEAGDLLYYTVTDDVAPSYSCAVPLSMSLERILTRFGNDSDSDSGCFYRNVEHILSDISLVLENCLLYNAPDSTIVESASIVIPRLKDLVLRASQAYVQELRDARRADDERKKLVLSMSDDARPGSSGAATSLARGPMLTTLRQPYDDLVDQDWLQEIEHRKTNFWIPQAGDRIQYSPAKHAAFIKGHYRSLDAEQCLVPSCFAEASEQRAEEWISGRVVWCRASYPKAPSKRSNDDQMTFPSNATLMALGVQSDSSENIFVVYYRPCGFSDEQLSGRCSACGLEHLSFIRVDENGSSECVAQAVSAHIEKCLGFIKKRCMKREVVSSLDSNLDKVSVKQGYKVPKVKLALKSLPSFQSLLLSGREEPTVAQSSSKGTRGVKLKLTTKPLHSVASIASLSASGFLPKWAARLEELDKDMRVSPWPKMSLELIFLRLQNGYYRHHEAVSNDIVEAFVSSVSLLVSEPASRKKSPLQIKRIARLSMKASIEDIQTDSSNAVSEEELSLASRIKQMRDTHALALVSVSNMNHFECLFGLSDDPVNLPVGHAVAKKTAVATDPVREKARRTFDLLLEAVAKDQLLNIFGQKFHGERASIPESKLRIACSGRPVSHAKYFERVSKATAEMEDGRSIEVTIRANRKVVSWLKELEETIEAEDEIDETTDVPVFSLHEAPVRITCGGKPYGKASDDDLVAALSGRLGDSTLVRKVEDSMRFGMKDYEANESLSKFIFGRPGRRDPCARCQAFKRSFFTCRVRRSHSNPDFDWLVHFAGVGSVDQMLLTLDPSFVPNEQENNAIGVDGDTAVDSTTPAASKTSLKENGAKQDDDDDDAPDEEENKEEDDETADPKEQLEKAQLALKFGRALLTQAQAYADRPIRLNKEFIDAVYPVDPSDNHYIYCIICGLSGDLLCCDGCSNVFHSECLSLKVVPEDEEWFCEECSSSKASQAPDTADSTPVTSDPRKLRSKLLLLPPPAVSSDSICENAMNSDRQNMQKNYGTSDALDQVPTAVQAVAEPTNALVLGPFQRAEFDDAAAEKLNRLLFELNEARPERFRMKLRLEEVASRDDAGASEKRKRSQRDANEIGDEVTEPPRKRRERKPASDRLASPVVRPTEEVVELEASRFGRKRSRPQFLAENTLVGNYYASQPNEQEESPARSSPRRSRSSQALWDDPFDRLNTNAQSFLASLDISNAEEFLGTRTGDIADAFINWRQKQKLPPLKGSGAVATISGWKALCRDAAKEMGMDTVSTAKRPKTKRSEDSRPMRRRRRSRLDSSSDPIEGLSSTAREFLASVDITSAEALLGTRTSDLAEDLIKWRVRQGMPPLKGTGSIATISAWKTQCRKNEDAKQEGMDVKSTPVKKTPMKSSGKKSKAAVPESESESESDAEDADEEATAKVEAGDPLLGLPDYAQTFLASRGITNAADFLDTKSSELAAVYVTWRKRQGMPVLKGSGPGAHIGAWKAIARKPAKPASKKKKARRNSDESV